MRRSICASCKRPTKVCYCTAIAKVISNTKVLIIQHPQEESHPFNTGRMAHLCLSNSEIVVADRFSDHKLKELLAPPSALLYPSLPWMKKVEEVGDKKIAKEQIRQLVVLDATWRKSKKYLFDHPQLQCLPRVSLRDQAKSIYSIRKTSIEDGLSTIESIAAALEYLEGGKGFRRLLEPFQYMVNE